MDKPVSETIQELKDLLGIEQRCSCSKSVRYRVNITQTSTGKKGFDCTVEMEGGTEEEILAKSDSLVKQLEKRYPPEVK